MANQPYQRVSQDNGVYDSALIGSAIAAGGAGAGVFGTRMHYNGIEKRAERNRKRMEKGFDNLAAREQKEIDRYNTKMDNIMEKERTATNRNGQGRSDRENNRYNQKNVEVPLDKLESAHQKNMGRIRGELDKLTDHYGDVTSADYVKKQQSGHFYNKMKGGWRKAGIIGATAVVGAGIGASVDGINQQR